MVARDNTQQAGIAGKQTASAAGGRADDKAAGETASSAGQQRSGDAATGAGNKGASDTATGAATGAGKRIAGGKDSGRRKPNRVRRTDELIHQAHVNAIKEVFDHNTFQPALIRDMQRAQGRIIIHDPYVTPGGVERLAAALKSCIQRGVRVCVFIEQPRGWDMRTDVSTAPEAQARFGTLEVAIKALQNYGVHCNLREGIHEKMVVVDEQIFWEGTLNVLSHYHTSERMNRWCSRIETRKAIAKHHLDECNSCSRIGLVSEREQLRLLGARILQRRLSLGLTQAQVATLAQVNQPMISKLELGKVDCKVCTLMRICRALDMAVMQLPLFLAESIEQRTWT
ncbi:MAG: helix-turn-helix domain-containing protein [Candidatus Saccharimonadales bacterium]